MTFSFGIPVLFSYSIEFHLGIFNFLISYIYNLLLPVIIDISVNDESIPYTLSSVIIVLIIPLFCFGSNITVDLSKLDEHINEPEGQHELLTISLPGALNLWTLDILLVFKSINLT